MENSPRRLPSLVCCATRSIAPRMYSEYLRAGRATRDWMVPSGTHAPRSLASPAVVPRRGVLTLP